MLAKKLTAAPSSCAAITTIDGTVTWSELAQQVTAFADEFQRLSSRRVGICVPASASGIAAMAALDRVKAHAYLIDANASDDQIDELTRRFDLQAVIWLAGGECQLEELSSATTSQVAAEESTVTILTSGTEGVPKAATYTWQQLARPVRISAAQSDDVWLLTFRIHLYACLQVLLQALLNRQLLVIPSPTAEPATVVRLIESAQVTCASATPSYWRRLLLFGDRDLLGKVPLRQITLGGELSDQPILDSLKAVYPTARVTHIYATTELGRCFAVTDGFAGFPSEYLSGAGERPAMVDALLRVENEQLFVKPVHGSDCVAGDERQQTSEDGWMSTGDLVEVTADRVYFAGRLGDMINVGGNKVRPAVVEAVIRTLPGVADVRVFGQSSSIAGQLVACELVPESGTDAAELRLQVQTACRESLQPYQCPRLIKVVSEIEMSDAGKTKRRPT